MTIGKILFMLESLEDIVEAQTIEIGCAGRRLVRGCTHYYLDDVVRQIITLENSSIVEIEPIKIKRDEHMKVKEQPKLFIIDQAKNSIVIPINFLKYNDIQVYQHPD